MKSLNEIISENQNNIEFPFLGNTLIIPTKRRVYSQVKKKYNELALIASNKYADKIRKHQNVESIINNFGSDVAASYDDIFKEIVKDAVSVDCYTLDEATVKKICEQKKCYDKANSAIREYSNAYNSIIQKRNATISNIDRKTDWRTNASGIGGGLLGLALIGAGTATAAAAISKASSQFTNEIAAFSNNSEYKQKIINGVRESAQSIGIIMINTFKINDAITTEEKQKARAIFNNINTMQLTEEKNKELSLNILTLDPYQSEYYIAFIKKYLKNSKEIIAIANYMGVDLTDELSEIVKKVAIANIGTTPDDVKSCRKLLNDVIAELGFPEKCKQEAEQFIQERCVAIFKDYISKNIGTNEEAAKKLRIETEEFVKEYSLSQNNALVLYKQIDDKLNKYDIEYRTIMGVVFTSREYAEANRKAIEQNKDILYKTRNDFIFRRDIVENIEKIKRIQMHPNLIEKFVNGYNRLLTDFDNKCQNAKCYEDKLRGNNSMKGFMKSMTTNVESMKRDWLELTRNGQYSIYDIMGIQR